MDLQALVSPVFFNERMEEKPFFLHFVPSYTVQGLPWLRADTKA